MTLYEKRPRFLEFGEMIIKIEVIVNGKIIRLQISPSKRSEQGEHPDVKERDHLVEVGWNYEGVAWYAPESSEIPVSVPGAQITRHAA